MADSEDELVLGPEMHVCHYPPPVPCTACGGSGKIVLLVTARDCEQCVGSGQVWPAPREEYTPARMGRWRSKREFDELGRLIVKTTWFEPADAETGNAKG